MSINLPEPPQDPDHCDYCGREIEHDGQPCMARHGEVCEP